MFIHHQLIVKRSLSGSLPFLVTDYSVQYEFDYDYAYYED